MPSKHRFIPGYWMCWEILWSRCILCAQWYQWRWKFQQLPGWMILMALHWLKASTCIFLHSFGYLALSQWQGIIMLMNQLWFCLSVCLLLLFKLLLSLCILGFSLHFFLIADLLLDPQLLKLYYEVISHFYLSILIVTMEKFPIVLKYLFLVGLWQLYIQLRGFLFFYPLLLYWLSFCFLCHGKKMQKNLLVWCSMLWIH